MLERRILWNIPEHAGLFQETNDINAKFFCTNILEYRIFSNIPEHSGMFQETTDTNEIFFVRIF